MKNVVIRRQSAEKGQGSTLAISQRTGWEYEHDETDEQIDAIEGLIEEKRSEKGHQDDAFSWSSSTDDGEGDILIGRSYHEGGQWVSETWIIEPDGKVRAEG